jgi:hypothetical protein
MYGSLMEHNATAHAANLSMTAFAEAASKL